MNVPISATVKVPAAVGTLTPMVLGMTPTLATTLAVAPLPDICAQTFPCGFVDVCAAET